MPLHFLLSIAVHWLHLLQRLQAASRTFTGSPCCVPSKSSDSNWHQQPEVKISYDVTDDPLTFKSFFNILSTLALLSVIFIRDESFGFSPLVALLVSIVILLFVSVVILLFGISKLEYPEYPAVPWPSATPNDPKKVKIDFFLDIFSYFSRFFSRIFSIISKISFQKWKDPLE